MTQGISTCEPLISVGDERTMKNDLFIDMPDCNSVIRPGNIVKLGRFSTDTWTVNYGWYSFAGNRPVCGWYLTKDGGLTVKPLQLPDLDDIYFITHGKEGRCE